MDFGQLSSVEGIDFRLPPIDPRTARILIEPRADSNRPPLFVSIGCPVWNCDEWKGSLYPTTAKPSEFLHHYSRQLNSIELNATFYRTPTAEQTQTWIDQTPEEFRFFPKVHQAITHSHDSKLAEIELEKTRTMLLTFQRHARLGMPFLQLPPTFGPNQIEKLREVATALSEITPIAIEFRHPQWFYQNVLIGRAFELLQSLNATALITDTAGRRDVVHSTLTSSRAFVRFLGNSLHPSDHSRIQQWVNRIAEWNALGLKEIAFFVHQPDNAEAPKLIDDLIAALNSRLGLSLEKPRPVGQINLL